MSAEIEKKTAINSANADHNETKENVTKAETNETENSSIKAETTESSVKAEPNEAKKSSVTVEPSKTTNISKKPDPDLDNKIIRQIEYYFGDHNLSKDKFLKEQIGKDDGWISLKLLVTFRRLKDLSTDFEVILNALAKSSSKLIEISDDKEKIRRDPNKPLPESTVEEQKRSVYVKGFPLDSNLDQLLDYFRPYDVEHVFMRRLRIGKNEGTFKGSVFVLFKTIEEAENFVKSEGLKYGSSDLILERRLEYSARKEKQYQEVVKQREERKELKRKLRSETNGDSKLEEDNENKFDPESFEKGCLLKLVGLGTTTSWEDIKNTFKAHAEVAFVEYSRGLPEAIVRFTDKAGAKHSLEESKTGADDDKKLVICDTEIQATILEGEEEIEFWRNFHTMKQNRNKRGHSRNSRGRGRGGGSFRGGRGSFRGGRGFHNDRKRRNDRSENDRPRPKEIKLENH